MHARDGEPEGESEQVTLTLRDAEDSDYPTLLALWHELMDLHVQLDERFALSPAADQRFFNYLDTARSRDDYRTRVALYEGKALGFTIACILPNSPVYEARWIGYINDLCVTKQARRMGVGRALVEDAVEWLLDKGADSVEVYVAHRNQVAGRFWRAVGGRDYLERLSIDLEVLGIGAKK